MALLLVLVVLFAVERVYAERRPLLRGLYAAAAALSLAAIGVSESRAALVGIVAGGIGLALLLIRSWRSRSIALVALVLVFGAMLAIPGVGTRAASIVDFRNDRSAMDRFYLAEASWEMFVDHPVTGVGIQAWTVDEPAAIRYLCQKNIFGVITNRPDLAIPAREEALREVREE
jgi:O-antigen ligase